LLVANIEVQNLNKCFGDNVALSEVDLSIPDGSFVVLLGPTGAGKTTLLRLIAGLDHSDSGRVVIDGVDCTQRTPAERNVAMVFQQYSLYPHMSVKENLTFPLKSRMLSVTESEINRKIDAISQTLRIHHKLSNKATELSGGEMQRVAIGRALVRNPNIYLMDEPLSSLDAKLRSELRIELTRIQKDIGGTFLYVTHDQIEAMTMATHIGVLEKGKLIQFGTPREVYDHPSSVSVAARLGQPRINIVDATIFPGSPRAAKFIGFRPEQLELGAEGLQTLIKRVERLGDQTRLHLSLGEISIVTVTDPHTELKAGETLSIKPKAPFFFDSEGMRI
jgi:multiple sugar transport system ATP-binding protein